MPKQESQGEKVISTTIDKQLRINKFLRSLKEGKKELLNSGDLNEAEEVLGTVEELLKDERVIDSEEDFEDLQKKREILRAYIDNTQHSLEKDE